MRPGTTTGSTVNAPVLYSRAVEASGWRILTLVVVTVAIWIGFHIWTGVFISPRNLGNLAVQMSITALLTSGLTWLLVAREIDLSVGSLQAAAAVVAFQLMVTYNWGVWESITVVIGLGMLVGAIQGALRVFLRIPSFIVTLAGFSWLRGVGYVVSGSQTVAGAGDTFYEIGDHRGDNRGGGNLLVASLHAPARSAHPFAQVDQHRAPRPRTGVGRLGSLGFRRQRPSISTSDSGGRCVHNELRGQARLLRPLCLRSWRQS
jgi:ABC-type xylose transport system permease subunit